MSTTTFIRWSFLALALSQSALATNVPLPTPDATLNINATVQTQALVTESGALNGKDASFDVYVRRVRLTINGDFARYFSYYVQTDNANFGRFGNYTPRLVLQDAFFSATPMADRKADTLVYLDAGYFFYPASRFILTPISNQGTVEGHPDLLRGFNAGSYVANRSPGLQLRGWALDKKIGFRGGVFEGVQPAAGSATTGFPNPKRNPAVAGFVNFDVIGSEEGGYLYPTVRFAKDPVVSLSVAGSYQSLAIVTTKGLSDQRSLTSTLYVNLPQTEQAELIAIVGGYLYGNGTGYSESGMGASFDLGYRFGPVRPYAAYEYYNSNDCPTDGSATPAQCTTLHATDSRNIRAGVDFYFNKTLNHLQIELGLNRGQSSWGPQAITAGTAGYAPSTAGGPPYASLTRTPQKSLLAHWNVVF